MKRFFLALLSVFIGFAALAEDGLKYVDASTLTVIGKPKPTEKPFARIDGFDFKHSGINGKCRQSTGLAVVFKTDSHIIRAEWTTGSSCPTNMTAIGQKGLDLYIKEGGRWLFAGVGTPTMKEPFTKHSCTIISDMRDGEKECLLYLPLYDRIDSLMLGIEEGASIESMPNPFEYNIIFEGSSITHGAAAGRPGMSYTGLLGLKYGLYCMNMGFSGNSKLQKELAEYMAGLEGIDAFVFDAFSNPSAEEIETRFDTFMDILRKAHPTTPVIFLQTETRETRNFNMVKEKFEADKQAAAERKVRERMLVDPNMYFIGSEGFMPEFGFSTTDGTHPNDYAFLKTVDIIGPKIRSILEHKYDPRVEELLAKMTLEEKVGQLVLVTTKGDITGPTGGVDPRDDIRKGLCGNVFNAVGLDYIEMLQKIAVEESRLGIPLLFGYDEIHGMKTIFPICLGESCTWDPALIGRCARVGASEAAATGLNWTYNPMVDISWEPRWGRVSEGAGEDPWLGAAVARARVHGVQGDDLSDPLTIAACVKHYAAYGAPLAGREYNTVDMSERQFREYYLPTYKAAVEAGVASVMTSFNDFDAVPATGSKFLLRDILKGEMDFRGFVVTDYGSLGEMVNHGFSADKKMAAQQALEAGVDMDMASSSYALHLVELVRRGAVDIALVNDAVRRILQVKCDLGLFDDPYRYIDRKREKELLYCKENRQTALEEARASMVLLKNEGDVLPLKKGAKVALIGALATSPSDYLGSWRGKGETELTESVLDVFIREAGKKNVIYAKGCGIKDESRDGFAEAIEAAKAADKIVIIMGESHGMSGEAAARTDIRIPGCQTELLAELCKLGKPVVVVLMNGRPLDLSRESGMADAMLECWFPGSMGAQALLDVLYGKYNPSGHLTMSFPRTIGQVPLCYYAKSTGRPTDKKQGRFTSRYIDCPNSPLYPFGYGLSYTEFSYSPITMSASSMDADGSIEASVTVTNSGKVFGETVVQMYIRDMVGSVTRPLKMLRGFEKIGLKPGESRNVTFKITEDMLKFWRADMTYGSEPGTFRLFIGPDSSVEEYVEFDLK